MNDPRSDEEEPELTVDDLDTISADELREMCNLFGDYDGIAAERDDLARRLTAAETRIAAALAEIDSWQHETVEDCWYSCAATYGTDVEDACCNDALEGAGCTCGLDPRRNRLRAALADPAHKENADDYDRDHGIVRVDTTDPATVERAARALFDQFHEALGTPAKSTFDDNFADEQRLWIQAAAAVLSSLREGEA